MADVFREVVFMSITGSLLAITLFILLKIFKNKLSKTFQYYIWLIVIVWLVVPFSIEIPREQKISTYIAPVTIRDVVNREVITVEEELYNANSVAITQRQSKISQPVTFLIYLIWPIGLFASLMYTIVCYLRFNLMLHKTNIKCEDEEKLLLLKFLNNRKVGLYLNDVVKTPLLIGLLNPKIILPNRKYETQQLEYILLHELTHLKRLDIAYKWFCAFACCVHWFNPAVYFIRKEINKVCELSCDETVIKNLDAVGKQAYGETLISVVAQNKYPTSVITTTMCEEKQTLKERLVAIMKHKKTTKKIFVLSGVLLVVVVFVATALGVSVSKRNNDINTIAQIPKVYDFDLLHKHTSPYMGDNSNLLKLVALLPSPNSQLNQRFISMTDDQGTGNTPYSLTVYYEVESGEVPDLTGEMEKENREYSKICKKNALVLFSLIGNLEEVTFASRLTPSENGLVESDYTNHYTITRDTFKDYGELSKLWEGEQELLSKFLNEIDNEIYLTNSSEKIGMEDVIKLASIRDNLVMEDFKKFQGQDVGSGLLILKFEIDDEYVLYVGGGMTGKPMYAKLTNKFLADVMKEEATIDIRYSDVEEFLQTNKVLLYEPVEQKQITLPKISKVAIKYDNFNYYESDYKAYETNDVEIIKILESLIKSSIVISDSETKEMDRPNNPHGEFTIYDGNEKTIIPFIVDDLYEKIVFIVDGVNYLPNYDAARFIRKLDDFRPKGNIIDLSTKDFLSSYGLVPTFTISGDKIQLPDNLLYKTGYFPIKLYWAYALVMSKEDGFDFTNQLGKNITVEIVYLLDSLPQSLHPKLDKRAIILKQEGNIIGGFLTSHDGDFLTLSGKTFEEIKKENFETWATKNVYDLKDSLLLKNSQMTAQEVVHAYFKAINKLDESEHQYEYAGALMDYMFINKGNEKLYFTSWDDGLYEDISNNTISMNLLKIEEIYQSENEASFKIEVDIKVKKTITGKSGIDNFEISLVKENNASWKIVGMGH